MFLFAEPDGSEIYIREISLFAEGTNLFTKVCPGTPVIDLSSVMRENALLLFGSLSPLLSAEEHLSCLSAVFI